MKEPDDASAFFYTAVCAMSGSQRLGAGRLADALPDPPVRIILDTRR